MASVFPSPPGTLGRRLCGAVAIGRDCVGRSSSDPQTTSPNEKLVLAFLGFGSASCAVIGGIAYFVYLCLTVPRRVKIGPQELTWTTLLGTRQLTWCEITRFWRYDCVR